MKAIAEKYWHEIFEIGVFIKSLTGLVEVISGILLVSIRASTLHNILIRLSRGELTEDPQDFFFSYANQFLSHLTAATKDFAGFYILAHGLINLFLVLGLLKEKAWAYLVAIGVLSSFMLYQIFTIALRPSIFLEVLTAFDVFFVFLIWHEYKHLSGKLKSA